MATSIELNGAVLTSESADMHVEKLLDIQVERKTINGRTFTGITLLTDSGSLTIKDAGEELAERLRAAFWAEEGGE